MAFVDEHVSLLNDFGCQLLNVSLIPVCTRLTNFQLEKGYDPI